MKKYAVFLIVLSSNLLHADMLMHQENIFVNFIKQGLSWKFDLDAYCRYAYSKSTVRLNLGNQLMFKKNKEAAGFLLRYNLESLDKKAIQNSGFIDARWYHSFTKIFFYKTFIAAKYEGQGGDHLLVYGGSGLVNAIYSS
ncbi:MAG: hypothetical protein A2096_14760 [Spirochaetes bacterium GWF1_41_5]|nr:MAG: hypothetical protein A2096_14760 [Spirochaetes bacterium GWF1_41_5]